MTTWLPRWFVLIVLVFSFVPIVAAPAQPEGKAPPEVLKAQRDAARKTYELYAKYYPSLPPVVVSPISDVEKCYLWSRRWLEAERQLVGDGDENRVAVAAHLDRMKKLEEMTRKRSDAGSGAWSLDDAAAAFYRAEAETWVAQAKGK